MTELIQPSTDKHTCIVCNVTSDERVLIGSEKEGEQVYICVRCLPTIIHGAQ